MTDTPDFITFRASQPDLGTGRVVAAARTATSLRDQRAADRWQRRLEPWLLAGDPLGSAYFDFGGESAFLRWQSDPGASGAWDQALVLLGDSARLPGTYALELPRYTGTGPGAVQVLAPGGPAGPRRDAIAALARSAEAVAALIPALANALNGERRVLMPWAGTEMTDAVMWGLLTVLRLTSDRRPVSFRTHVTGHGRDGDSPGLLVTFRPDISEPQPQPEQGFAMLACDLAARFAENPAALEQMLDKHRVHEVPNLHDRVSRLLQMPLSRRFAAVTKPVSAPAAPGPVSAPAVSKPAVSKPVSVPAVPGPVSMPAVSKPVSVPAAPGPASPPGSNPSGTAPTRAEPGTADEGGKATVTASRGSSGTTVMCPVCLADIDNWDSLDYWRHDEVADDWVRIEIPEGLSPNQRRKLQFGAYVRCEKGSVGGNVHHLPARYGRFGEPVLLGFVGLTQSGKSHLLTAMIGRIKGLSDYQIAVEPLDPRLHNNFKESSLDPLMDENKALPGNPDGATALRDAFIVRCGAGPERVVALFDVSGGDLADTGMSREFLWIADGLFFVVDPDHIARSKVGDVTFTNVLSVVRDRVKPGLKGAAIILNKADKERFEEPVARWLRSGEGTLDPVPFLQESADVYAYLQRHDALALAAPYEAAQCEKVTLHVASPTGGAKDSEDQEGRYPRGVTPRRVLRPLIAMLAMTGVLTGPQAELIGV